METPNKDDVKLPMLTPKNQSGSQRVIKQIMVIDPNKLRVAGLDLKLAEALKKAKGKNATNPKDLKLIMAKSLLNKKLKQTKKSAETTKLTTVPQAQTEEAANIKPPPISPAMPSTNQSHTVLISILKSEEITNASQESNQKEEIPKASTRKPPPVVPILSETIFTPTKYGFKKRVNTMTTVKNDDLSKIGRDKVLPPEEKAFKPKSKITEIKPPPPPVVTKLLESKVISPEIPFEVKKTVSPVDPLPIFREVQVPQMEVESFYKSPDMPRSLPIVIENKVLSVEEKIDLSNLSVKSPTKTSILVTSKSQCKNHIVLTDPVGIYTPEVINPQPLVEESAVDFINSLSFMLKENSSDETIVKTITSEVGEDATSFLMSFFEDQSGSPTSETSVANSSIKKLPCEELCAYGGDGKPLAAGNDAPQVEQLDTINSTSSCAETILCSITEIPQASDLSKEVPTVESSNVDKQLIETPLADNIVEIIQNKSSCFDDEHEEGESKPAEGIQKVDEKTRALRKGKKSVPVLIAKLNRNRKPSPLLDKPPENVEPILDSEESQLKKESFVGERELSLLTLNNQTLGEVQNLRTYTKKKVAVELQEHSKNESIEEKVPLSMASTENTVQSGIKLEESVPPPLLAEESAIQAEKHSIVKKEIPTTAGNTTQITNENKKDSAEPLPAVKKSTKPEEPPKNVSIMEEKTSTSPAAGTTRRRGAKAMPVMIAKLKATRKQPTKATNPIQKSDSPTIPQVVSNIDSPTSANYESASKSQTNQHDEDPSDEIGRISEKLGDQEDPEPNTTKDIEMQKSMCTENSKTLCDVRKPHERAISSGTRKKSDRSSAITDDKNKKPDNQNYQQTEQNTVSVDQDTTTPSSRSRKKSDLSKTELLKTSTVNADDSTSAQGDKGGETKNIVNSFRSRKSSERRKEQKSDKDLVPNEQADCSEAGKEHKPVADVFSVEESDSTLRSPISKKSREQSKEANSSDGIVPMDIDLSPNTSSQGSEVVKGNKCPTVEVSIRENEPGFISSKTDSPLSSLKTSKSSECCTVVQSANVVDPAEQSDPEPSTFRKATEATNKVPVMEIEPAFSSSKSRKSSKRCKQQTFVKDPISTGQAKVVNIEKPAIDEVSTKETNTALRSSRSNSEMFKKQKSAKDEDPPEQVDSASNELVPDENDDSRLSSSKSRNNSATGNELKSDKCAVFSEKPATYDIPVNETDFHLSGSKCSEQSGDQKSTAVNVSDSAPSSGHTNERCDGENVVTDVLPYELPKSPLYSFKFRKEGMEEKSVNHLTAEQTCSLSKSAQCNQTITGKVIGTVVATVSGSSSKSININLQPTTHTSKASNKSRQSSSKATKEHINDSSQTSHTLDDTNVNKADITSKLKDTTTEAKSIPNQLPKKRGCPKIPKANEEVNNNPQDTLNSPINAIGDNQVESSIAETERSKKNADVGTIHVLEIGLSNLNASMEISAASSAVSKKKGRQPKTSEIESTHDSTEITPINNSCALKSRIIAQKVEVTKIPPTTTTDQDEVGNKDVIQTFKTSIASTSNTIIGDDEALTKAEPPHPLSKRGRGKKVTACGTEISSESSLLNTTSEASVKENVDKETEDLKKTSEAIETAGKRTRRRPMKYNSVQLTKKENAEVNKQKTKASSIIGQDEVGSTDNATKSSTNEAPLVNSDKVSAQSTPISLKTKSKFEATLTKDDYRKATNKRERSKRTTSNERDNSSEPDPINSTGKSSVKDKIKEFGDLKKKPQAAPSKRGRQKTIKDEATHDSSQIVYNPTNKAAEEKAEILEAKSVSVKSARKKCRKQNMEMEAIATEIGQVEVLKAAQLNEKVEHAQKPNETLIESREDGSRFDVDANETLDNEDTIKTSQESNTFDDDAKSEVESPQYESIIGGRASSDRAITPIKDTEPFDCLKVEPKVKNIIEEPLRPRVSFDSDGFEECDADLSMALIDIATVAEETVRKDSPTSSKVAELVGDNVKPSTEPETAKQGKARNPFRKRSSETAESKTTKDDFDFRGFNEKEIEEGLQSTSLRLSQSEDVFSTPLQSLPASKKNKSSTSVKKTPGKYKKVEQQNWKKNSAESLKTWLKTQTMDDDKNEVNSSIPLKKRRGRVLDLNESAPLDEDDKLVADAPEKTIEKPHRIRKPKTETLIALQGRAKADNYDEEEVKQKKNPGDQSIDKLKTPINVKGNKRKRVALEESTPDIEPPTKLAHQDANDLMTPLYLPTRKRGRPSRLDKIIRSDGLRPKPKTGAYIPVIRSSPLERKFKNDTEFNPRLLLITQKEQIKTDEPLEDPNLQKEAINSDDVQCALCIGYTPKKKWIQHVSTHYGIGWIMGQPPPLNVKSRSSVLNYMVDFFRVTKVKGLQCRICGALRRSALGLLTHLEQCCLTTDEVKETRVVCEHCNNDYSKMTIAIHQRTCSSLASTRFKEKVKETTQTDTGEQVLSNTGRLKRKSVIIAEDKFKSLNDSEFIPDEVIRHVPVVRTDHLPTTWSKEIQAFGKGFCVQKKCSFTSTDIQELVNHCQFGVCTFILKPGYLCTKCRFNSADIESCRAHVVAQHAPPSVRGRGDNSDDAEFDSESTSDTGSSGDDEGESDYTRGSGADDADGEHKSKRKKKKNKSHKRSRAHIQKSLPTKDFKKLLPDRASDIRYQVAKWYNKLIQQHYTTDALFPFATANALQVEKECNEGYFPKSTNSMKFVLKGLKTYCKEIGRTTLQSDQWQTLEWMKGIGIPHEHIAYMGGPVRSLAWAPLDPHPASAMQYLAIIAKKQYDKYTRFTNPRFSRSLIYIQKYHTNDELEIKGEIHYAVVIDTGPVHCIEFLPSGGFAPQMNRLGLLAVGTVQTEVKIYSLPLEVKTRDCDNFPVVRLEPSFVLCLEVRDDTSSEETHEYNSQCMSLSWSHLGGHNYIIGGYLNGFIAIWDICDDDDNLNRFLVKGLRTFVPVTYFSTMDVRIKHLAPHYDINGLRWLVVINSNRKLLLYDLRELNKPVLFYVETMKNNCNSVDWPLVWENPSCACGDSMPSYGKCINTVSPMNLVFVNRRFDKFCCGVNDIHFNPWRNVYAGAGDNGDIQVTQLREAVLDVGHRMKVDEKATSTLDLVPLNKEVIITRAGEKLPEGWRLFEPDFKEKYGLVFGSVQRLTVSRNPEYYGQKRMPTIALSRLMRVNRLRFNVNRNADSLLAIGYENGFIRVVRNNWR